MLPVGADDLLTDAGVRVEDLRMPLPFGRGLMICLPDELGKLAIRDRGFVEPKGINLQGVGRSLVGGIGARTPHDERAGRDENHSCRGVEREWRERWGGSADAFEVPYTERDRPGENQ